MEQLQIQILGNGGCLNNGLAYHAFLLNRTFLIEAPPDLMLSVKRLALDETAFSALYISHLHCDHTFGFPFLAINRWVLSLQQPLPPLIVYGPPGTEQMLRTLISLSFEPEHPCVSWSQQAFTFCEIDDGSCIHWEGLQGTFFLLEHLKYTYGMRLCRPDGSNLFSYIADTSWCPQVEQVLQEKPALVIADMHGGDPRFHMSREDFLRRGRELAGPETRFYGSHLNDEFAGEEGRVGCATVGTVLTVPVQ